MAIDNAIKEIFNELNANLQRPRTPTHPTAITSSINMPSDPSAAATTTTINIPLIDDIIEDLVLFSQQLLLPRAVQADAIEIIEASETEHTDDGSGDNNNGKRRSNLSDIDVEKCNNALVNEKLTSHKNENVVDTTTTTIDIENNNNNGNVMNDEEYEKWFYINNTGLAIVLPFVVSIY